MRAVLITSSLLICLLAALRPLLRGRIDPRVQYALWLTIALRLLIPVNLFTSAYGALALLDKAQRPAQAVQAIGQTHVPVPGLSYDDAYVLALREYQQDSSAATSFTDLERVEARARELMERTPTLSELAARYARPVWLGGMAAMAGWFLLANLSLRRRLKRARRLDRADCPLPVYVSDALPSPCLCGALRPRIYVTPAALDSPDRLRHVLAHELAHHRHRDHWWAILRCACLCLYWFDPLVWWAAALSRQDCELACDAGAIHALGEDERIPYGRTLVGMIAAGRTSLLQTATTMTGGKRRVRQRIKLIARRPKTVLAVALAAALVLALAVGCAFSGAPEEAKTLDNLQQRLEELPDELRDRVRVDLTNEAPGRLAYYWLEVPAEWTEDFHPWLLSVLTLSQEELDQTAGSFALNHAPEPFAKSGSQYYALHWSVAIEYGPEDKELFNAAFEAVRDFAMQTVLETEGVEAYSPPGRLSADTLQTRLLDVPEDLQADVAALSGSEPTATLNNDFTALAQYWMNRPWADYDEIGMGWLLTLYQWDQEQFEWLYPDNEATGGVNCFAKDDNFYYVLFRATDARAPMSETGYMDAFNAIRAYAVEQVLATEGVEAYTPEGGQTGTSPAPEAQGIQDVVNRLLAAPSVTLSLAPAGSSRVYAYPIDPSQDQNFSYLSDLASDFRWEEAPYSASAGAASLRLEASDGSASLFLSEGSYLATDGDGNCWKATYRSDSYLFPGGESVTPYDYLRRRVFDPAELDALRSTAVPDRGQSHEDVVREWIVGYEGAMTKTAPGSQFACTYVRPGKVTADVHAGLTAGALEEFVSSRVENGLTAADYGKTWFTFGYELVFVPAGQSDDGWAWAGNTDYYQGDGAPEGALTWSRVGYMYLIDGNWVCENTGTGW
ncbi:MAG: M56 family metallopeptidase [Oscillospiraceae bacterium]|nr:M56 family metallopeptidase [Oscillospiraceae bacterium]